MEYSMVNIPYRNMEYSLGNILYRGMEYSMINILYRGMEYSIVNILYRGWNITQNSSSTSPGGLLSWPVAFKETILFQFQTHLKSWETNLYWQLLYKACLLTLRKHFPK